MKYKKIYAPGKKVANMSDLDFLIRNKCWFYFGRIPSRPKHHGVIVSMTYRTLSNAVDAGHLWVAVKAEGQNP